MQTPRIFKLLMGSSVVLVLAGLAGLQLLAVFSGVTGIQLGKNSILQPATNESQAQKKVFETPGRHPESAHSVRISVVPTSPRMRTVNTEMTDGERVVKQELETLLLSRAPTHRLIYDGGKILTGRLVEEHPDYIVFAEKYGKSGEMSITLPRSRIVCLETCSVPQPVISRRDVRFFMEFPDKQFYKRPPYTIIAEESFFAVEHIVEQQQNLYSQFIEWFTPLITVSGRRDDVQLLILSSLDAYSIYCDRYAPELKGNSGFYSRAMDRMVVYRQRDADWVKDSERKITATEKQYRAKLRTAQARGSLAQWENDARGHLLANADETTQSAIRHEGAHQLFFTLGVQHPSQNGRGWLTEGLATFCDTEKIGQINFRRRDELKSALSGGRLIPLYELMTSSRCGNSLAYSESWSLTHMLMQPEYRSGFFSYLEWIRNNPATPVGDPFQELCQFIPLPHAGLESRWMEYINQLTLLK